MTTKEINWLTCTELLCAGTVPSVIDVVLPATLLYTVPSTLYGLMPATLTGARLQKAFAPECGWVYTIEYDDEYLAEGYELIAANIYTVICGGMGGAGGFEPIDTSCDAVRGCVSVESSDTVALTYDSDTGVVSAESLLAVTDSTSVDLTLTGPTLSAAAKISNTAGNALSVVGTGLYVANPTVVSVTDTPSVNLTLTGTALSADVLTTYSTWTPTVTASGAMTVSGLTVSLAQYFTIGSTTFFDVALLFTLGGVQSTNVYFTLPQTALTMGNQAAFPASVAANSVGVAGSFWRVDHTDLTRAVVALKDVANWTLGAGASISIQGRFNR